MRTNKSLLFIIFFLLLALIVSLFLLFNTTSFSGRASTGGATSDVAIQNSYLFASPIQAKADGLEKVRLTVFVLDTQGLGVSQKTVALEASGDITITPLAPITDDTGKATFDVSSTLSGRARLSATVDGKKIPQTVSIVFY